ncbi:hypothetical protein CHLRE_09g402034v5 [Chlamydomonas reinhardtii]|uniref:Adenylyltransferase and sulfurtransferase MOCS3 n=1 Tax=Chlamydomonas reinhardtii TaxID=3055 RepID=A0A2K3DF32_CHLRE|nr:uncharacterized protein CHLRE_09g402034v5 [Chlamydomonas reinhardtii]PNW79139.1 hypothetical protein CHLRE_09g402034v5 [Chlamydomonas reinhardtii]
MAMGDASIAAEAAALRVKNASLEREVESLREQLLALRAELGSAKTQEDTSSGAAEQRNGGATATTSLSTAPSSAPAPPRAAPRHGLSRAQVERYSRHLLLPAFGVAAQERLLRGGVLVVGCGGLGSPVAMYLAAAGVGRLGLVDHDTVDVTNLHRQVMHSTARVGQHKAASGRATCTAINPTIQVEAHMCGFTPANALELVDRYDVVVDASDNPATRYLVSDACVVAGKPLVSAAAVGTDGQITVYNYGPDGPCYRCLFPESPAPENCSRCGEAGVLGVVPGVMGCLQALEAIKVLAGVGDVSSKKLTIFDALSGRFTAVKLRGRSPACLACGAAPLLSRANLAAHDYVRFTGQPLDDGPPEDLELLDPRVRLQPAQVAELMRQQQQQQGSAEPVAAAAAEAAGPTTAEAAAAVQCRSTVFLDVRPQPQYDVVALPGVVHVPFERLEQRLAEVLALCGCSSSSSSGDGGVGGSSSGSSNGDGGSCNGGGGAGSSNGGGGAGCGVGAGAAASGEAGEQPAAAAAAAAAAAESPPRVVVLCRRGNNSQRVAARLAAAGVAGVTDMRGGYQAWAREVDPDVPLL